MSEALRLAAVLEDEKMHSMAIDTEAAAELRRLHAELERKSDAIQRLWKERDELLSECRTLVRQNGEWQELTAELREALREMLKLWQDDPAYGHEAADKAWELLAKVEASK